jgi:rhodanese-related sulfurtransferase
MKNLRNLIFLCVAALMVTSCACKQDYNTVDEMVMSAMKTVRLITPQELNTLMQGTGDEIYTLMDVRQEVEHYYGFIPGSVVIPRGSLEFSISDSTFWEHVGLYMPEKTEKIIVYCKKGQRGILAAETLSKLGYSNVYALEGGWKNWEVAFPDIYEKDMDKLGGKTAPASSGGC